MKPDGNDAGGVLLTLLCALSYGMAPAMARLAYEAGTDVLTATTGRFVAGVIGITVLILASRRALALPRPAALGASGLGLLSAMTSLGYMGSIFYIPASLAVLIFCTYPLLVALGARWTEGEPVTGTKLAALLVAFGGLAIALGVTLERLDPRGMALAAMASVGAAAHVLAIGRVVRRAGGTTLAVSLRSMATAMLVSAVLLAFQGGPTSPVGTTGWIGLLGTLLFFTAGVTLMYAGVARLGPVRAAILLNLEPLIAILAAVLILGESFGPQQVAGASLVVGAVAWVQLRRAR